MRKNDLDALMDGGLDDAAMQHAQIHLESLCDFMERNAIDSGFSRPENKGAASKYHRLDALLYELSSTSWAFDMVSGTARRLFQSVSPGKDIKEVEKFNEFFGSLTKPSIVDICFLAKAVPSDEPSPDSGHPQEQLGANFDRLSLLLSRFQDSLKCDGNHDVLLNISASRRGSRVSRLELFLSTCRIPRLWLESRLDTLSLSESIELHPINDQLCEHIHDTRDIGDRLYLIVANEEIYIRGDDECSEIENKSSSFYTSKQPSKTLKELLESGAFNSSVFGYDGPRFTENEKRELAATLVSNLALSVVSSRTIKCWDPTAIYFLAEPNGECIRNCPYALCTSSSKADHKQNPHNEAQQRDLALEDTDFELLAKLLLEIKGWSLPNDIALLTTIEREMNNNLGNQRYLRAVHDCLKFRSLYQRHIRRRASKGHKVDEVTVVKDIISTIVKGIKAPIQRVLGGKRQFGDEEDFGYAISSDCYHLGMSTESGSQIQRSSPQLVYSGDQTPTKRVRFEYCRPEERFEPTTGLPSDANISQNSPNPHTRNYSTRLNPTVRFHTSSRSRSPGPPRESHRTPEPVHTPHHIEKGKFSNLLKDIPSPPADCRDFEIVIICALTLEANAVEALFDKYWDSEGYKYHKSPMDPNAYSTGVIGSHNVILAHMPAMGKGSAARVAANCRYSFTGIKLALVVGICGAVPFKKTRDEILLGEVVISSGIIQYDFGRRYSNEFVRKSSLVDNLGRHNTEVQAHLNMLQTRRNTQKLQEKTLKYLSKVLDKFGKEDTYPGPAEDRLFPSDYRHKHSSGCTICAACNGEGDPVCDTAIESSCYQLGCDKTQLVSRNRLHQAPEANKATGQAATNKPAIHFGLVASGDTVMKSGGDRDAIAANENIIAFEMEGAGVCDTFPCLVIKGVCDYADSHKSKNWQNYAAASAAACMKAFLKSWPKTGREGVSF
ncbi:hypothetical protein H072_7247 [Dactylellina haptotyla CBS 200.50]|uniref:Uncharacterized protein n=1 Tax=Dactylellina haptotyla (strain CBS 200.50) TaxID=1284197 RepID=S8A818_DACHA|nr:hypothetical protein H072_7247 [Dactylellina haptotyla CBS 200.50]